MLFTIAILGPHGSINSCFMLLSACLTMFQPFCACFALFAFVAVME